MSIFPLENTVLSRITAKNKTQLFRLIDENLELKTNLFFKKYNLERFTHIKFMN